MALKQVARAILPPALRLLLNMVLFRNRLIHWEGDYPDWASAVAQSAGYDSPEVIEKVFAAHRLVVEGSAACERDSVIYDTLQYSWPALAGLLWSAARHGGQLHLIDFGGAFGGFYYLNRAFFDKLPSVRWNVVEQTDFVSRGCQYFETEFLKFYPEPRMVLADDPSVNTVFFGSVLQYLPEPYACLKNLFSLPIDTVIIDRTSFTTGPGDRITVQQVPAWIYRASYPCRFFSYNHFVNYFEEHGFRLIESFPALEGRLDATRDWRGMIFAR